MKKKFFLIGALVVMSMSAMFVACNGNSPSNGCSCTASYQGETETQSISLAEMKERGWSTCADVTNYLRANAIPGVSVSCTAY